MGKLGDVRGNVALTIDKLAGIRGDLVRNDDNWQNWDFVKLCDALGSWIRRNPVESSEDHRDETPNWKRDQIPRRSYATQQTRACVYCDDPTHRSFECHRVTSFDERKNILAKKKPCFNCTGPKHRYPIFRFCPVHPQGSSVRPCNHFARGSGTYNGKGS